MKYVEEKMMENLMVSFPDAVTETQVEFFRQKKDYSQCTKYDSFFNPGLLLSYNQTSSEAKFHLLLICSVRRNFIVVV